MPRSGPLKGDTPYLVTASAGSLSTTFSLTNTVGSPNTISVVTGNPGNSQSTVVGTAFTYPLVAHVTDVYGNPIANANVLFTGPATQPNAVFNPNAVTNSAGNANVTVTAGTKTGTYTVTATTAGVTSNANFTLTNLAAPAANLVVASPNPQSTTVHTAFPLPLVAAVTDTYGNPLQNANVLFAVVPAGNGASATLSNPNMSTDINGNANITATAGNTAGSYTVVASLGALNANFTLNNTPGAAFAVALLSSDPGNAQSAVVDTAFANPLVAHVEDIYGNGVSGVNVTYSAPGTEPTAILANPNALTNAAGNANISATAGPLVGSYIVVANVSGLSGNANFALTNTAGSPNYLTVVSPDPQTTMVNTAFPSPLVAAVTDIHGNPVPNANVLFAVNPSGGATATLSNPNMRSDASGNANITATAGTVAGSYTVTASLGTLASTFHLANAAGNANHVSITASSSPQSATVNTAFATPLTVLVTDQYNNPVQGANVVFAATTVSGATASLAHSTVTTDSSGNANTVATAGTVVGTYTVSATTNGASTTFTLTNTVGNANQVSVASGSPQSTTPSSSFALPLTVLVVDNYNNPVPGVTVDYTVNPNNGATATLSNPNGVTGATGNANVTAISGSSAGTFTVTASINGGASTTTFTLTTLMGSPNAVTVVSGSGQNTVVSTAFSSALVAKVFDASNNPLPGVVVTFTTPGSTYATPTGGASTTDTNGIASINLTAGSLAAASYTVAASVAHVAQTANFTLTNTPAAATHLRVTSPDPQSTVVHTAFADPLVATVTDQFSNPIANANVLFNVIPAGNGATANLSNPNMSTDISGNANITATAGDVAGTYTVVATFGGMNANFTLNNAPGVPAFVVLNTNDAGNIQSATVDVGFANPLVAHVKDAYGNAVPGVTVAFAVPGSEPTAILANPNALTDAAGDANISLTAGSMIGTYDVVATVAGVSGNANYILTNTAGSPNYLTVTSPDPQTTTVHTAFPTPLVATVTDSHGNPVANANVSFAATTSGGGATATLSSASMLADASGNAHITATAGDVAGTYTVGASLGPLTATFNLTNVAGAIAHVNPAFGAAQSAQVGTAFVTPLTVSVTDQYFNPVQGANVVFAASTLGGATATLAQSTVVTNGSGNANTVATAGTVVGGPYAVTATAGGIAGTFNLTNTPGNANVVTVASGSPQSATPSQTFTAPLKVLVVDAFNNPVPGADVSYTVNPNGAAMATLSNPNALTDASGNANVTATAGTTAGTYTVTASINGGASRATFTLTTLTGSPNAITVSSGSGQSTVVNTAFGQALVASVVDASNNPLSGVVVTFTTPGSTYATPTGGTAATDGNGMASISLTAGTLATGPYTVAAGVSGVAQTAHFTLTNTAGAATHLLVTSRDPQTAEVNTPFADPLVATVTDRYNNPVANANVLFNAVAATNGATATLSNPNMLTDAIGNANITATAGTVAGSYVVNANFNGLNANFTLTNTAGPAAHIAAILGAAQTANVTTAFATPLTVLVTDAYGNPVQDANVFFTATSVSGATATFANPNVVTDSNGNASTVATANSVAGGPYTVSAAVPGVTTPASFSLTNAGAVGCTNDTQCGSSAWCDNASCVAKLANGQPMPGGAPIGGICNTTNGARVCLSGACDTSANVCGLSNGEGPCSSNSVCISGACGSDGACGLPNGDTCANANTCRSGICDTDGKCGLPNGDACTASVECRSTCFPDGFCGYVNGTPCTGDMQCRVDICAPDQHCGIDLGGACTSGTECRSGACRNNVCVNLCSSDSDCAAGETYCDAQTSRCVPTLVNGTTCDRAAECASGICYTDGACGVPTGTTCANVSVCRSGGCAGSSAVCQATCSSDSDCPSTDSCDSGTQTCVAKLSNATSCTRNGQCVTNICASDNMCGEPLGGACGSAAVCRSNTCSTGGVCSTLCQSNADCLNTRYCDTSSGQCEPLLSNGQGCQEASECVSYTCTAGTCGQVNSQPCTSNAACTSSICNPNDNRCGWANGGACSAIADCRSGICSGGVCEQCAHDSDCPAEQTCNVPAGVCTSLSNYGFVGGGGCTTAGAPLLGWFLVLGLATRRRWWRSLGVFFAVLMFAQQAHAGVSGYTLDRFTPTTVGEWSFWVDKPWYVENGNFLAVGLTLDYTHDPLLAGANQSGSVVNTTPVISDQLVGHFDIAASFIDRITLSAVIPVVFLEDGSAQFGVSPLQHPALGDPRIGGMFRLFGHSLVDPLSVHAGAQVWWPVRSGSHVNDGEPRMLVKVAVNGLAREHLSWAGTAGFLGRRVSQAGILPEASGDTVGSELQLGGSLYYMEKNQGWALGPEAVFTTVVTTGNAFVSHSSGLEVMLAGHYQPLPFLRVGLAGGGGILKEPGTPAYRVLARLVYAPTFSEPPPDRDGDGVVDAQDACPNVAGVADPDPKANGCPPDADRDGVVDNADACVQEPQGEHPDPARAGCPMPPDQDKDGVPDGQDACVSEPQGEHPDPTRAGCPDGDKDKDGVRDSVDVCPDIPQAPLPDPNRAGCPLPDRDQDQVPDHLDACPDTPGMPSSDAKKNGCPGLLKIQGSQIQTTQPVFFANNKDVILARSFPVLQALASVLQTHPGIVKLSIEGHTDKRGNAKKNLTLSQRRANSVQAFLIKAGVAAERLEAHGYGDTKPIASNKTEAGRAANRRVEFKILKQE